MQFYVLNIQPLNLFEITQLFCHKCYQVYSFRDFVSQDVQPCLCPKCLSEMEAIYRMQFIVKDQSLYQLQGGIKAVLYTLDGVCNRFFNGITPSNLYKDQISRNNIEKFLRHIIRFNVFLDAIVEKKVLEGNEVVLKLISCRLKAV